MISSRRLLLLTSILWFGDGVVVASSDTPNSLGDNDATPSSRVLDRLWIWTHRVGAHDGIDVGGGRKGKSLMMPVGGAASFGVPNLYFIHYPNNPPASKFSTVVESVRPMKRVVLSLTGAWGDTSPERIGTALKLAQDWIKPVKNQLVPQGRIA
jgi:hypothetical protein